MKGYNFRDIQCTSYSLRGGLVTIPWGGPYNTWCYLFLDLAKFEVVGEFIACTLEEKNMIKKHEENTKMRNLIIFKIQGMIVQKNQKK
jgi:hypothetical protein